MIQIILTNLKIDTNTRKISLAVGSEPTSPGFRGRCLNHSDDDATAWYSSRHFRQSYSMLYTICIITLGNKEKVSSSGFRDVKMFRGILETSPCDWFPQIVVLTQMARGEGGYNHDFSHFRRFQPTVYETAATLQWSHQYSWIKWSLLTPLISLVEPGSQFHGPRGRIREHICDCCKIQWPMTTILAHWLELAATLGSYASRK